MEFKHPCPARRGFAFADLLIVIAVVAMLAALLLPALARAKQKARRINCVNNLKQVGLAFRLWSGDNGDLYPSCVATNKGGSLEYVPGGNAFRHFLCMSNELNTPKILACPSDNRPAAANFSALSNGNVSYFAGVDANEMMPQMFLTGDRNLVINGTPATTGLVSVKTTDTLSWTAEIHRNEGNIGLADGSVMQPSIDRLQQMLRHTGTNVNRLAIP